MADPFILPVHQAQLSALSAGSSGPKDWSASLATTQVGGLGILGVQNTPGVYDATANKTFLAFYGDDFWLTAMEFDHSKHRWSRAVRISAPPTGTEFDAHGVPSLAVDDQGTIHLLYGSHDTVPVYAKSNAPRSVEGGWTVTNLAVGIGTYHNLAWEPVTSALYATYRTSNGNPAQLHGSTYPAHEFGGLLRSTDHGATWTELGAAGTPNYVNLSGFSAAAAKDYYVTGIEADGTGRLWMTWLIAEGAIHDQKRHSVFVVAFNAVTGNYETADGTSLGTSVAGSTEILQCRASAPDRIGYIRMLINQGKPTLFYSRPIETTQPAGPLGSDAFGGEADGTNLTAHRGEGISGWTKKAGSADDLLMLASGTVYGVGAANFAWYIAKTPAPAHDHAVEMVINLKSAVGFCQVGSLGNAANFPDNASEYTLLYDPVTPAISIRRIDSASTTTVLATTTLTAPQIALGAHTLRLTIAGAVLTGSVDGVDVVTFTDPTPGSLLTRRGYATIRVRNATTTTGCHLDSVTYRSTGKVEQAGVFALRWTGSAWAEADLGARHHNLFHTPAAYKDADGSLVCLCANGRETEVLSQHPFEDWVTYNRIGDDVAAYRSTDNGATWAKEAQVIDRRRVRGQGVSTVIAPRGAKAGLRALALSGSMTPYIAANSSGANRINGRLGMYAIDDQLDPHAGLPFDSAPVEQLIDIVALRGPTAPPTAGTWLNLDLSNWVTENTTNVRLRLQIVGDGVAGVQAVRFRRAGTNYSVGEAEAAVDGTQTTIQYVWVPIDRNGQIEWTQSGTHISTVQMWFAGVRTG